MDAKNAIEDKEMAKARARNADGTFIADDPSTPNVDEAWVDVPDSAPKVFGWVAGKPVSRQIHPVTNPEIPANE